MKIARITLAAALLAGTSLGLACKKPEPAPAPAPAPVAVAPAPAGVSVVAINLGNAVGADKKVVQVMTDFKPSDTIYAAVATSGTAASATIAAKWLYGAEGQLVSEESIAIAPTGDAVTDFQISKPDGWPVGDYRVEITLDGKPSGNAAFRVVG